MVGVTNPEGLGFRVGLSVGARTGLMLRTNHHSRNTKCWQWSLSGSFDRSHTQGRHANEESVPETIMKGPCWGGGGGGGGGGRVFRR